MSTQDHGGPAFPLADSCCEYGGTNRSDANGMTLRDWFAGRVAPAIFTQLHTHLTANRKQLEGSTSVASITATAAYELADAMLKARQS